MSLKPEAGFPVFLEQQELLPNWTPGTGTMGAKVGCQGPDCRRYHDCIGGKHTTSIPTRFSRREERNCEKSSHNPTSKKGPFLVLEFSAMPQNSTLGWNGRSFGHGWETRTLGEGEEAKLPADSRTVNRPKFGTHVFPHPMNPESNSRPTRCQIATLLLWLWKYNFNAESATILMSRDMICLQNLTTTCANHFEPRIFRAYKNYKFFQRLDFSGETRIMTIQVIDSNLVIKNCCAAMSLHHSQALRTITSRGCPLLAQTQFRHSATTHASRSFVNQKFQTSADLHRLIMGEVLLMCIFIFDFMSHLCSVMFQIETTVLFQGSTVQLLTWFGMPFCQFVSV